MDAEHGSASNSPTLKSACSNCRKQKIACHSSGIEPCRRCRKMNLSCTYEPRYFRGQKRKETLAQAISASRQSPISQQFAIAGDMSDGMALQLSSHSRTGSDSYSAPSLFSQGPSHIPFPNSASVSEASPQATFQPNPPTAVLGRTLDGLHVDGDTIRDLFSIYFFKFSPFLPILDPSVQPNDYYQHSAPLFWAIIAVASRRYKTDPTLMGILPTKALNLAIQAIYTATAGVSAIESMLLLLSWPPPANSTYDEMPYVLSSALIHAAMKIGLQIPHACQDFSRVKVKLSERECNRRYQLWTHCLVLYQRSTCCVGNGFSQFVTLPSAETERQIRNLDQSLHLQRDIQDIVTKASLSLAENGLDLKTDEQLRAFDILFKSFVDRLSAVNGSNTALSPIDRIYVAIGQIMVQSFQLFRPADKHNTGELLTLYSLACSLIAELDEQERKVELASHGPYYIFQGTLIAACCLLRLLKTPLGRFDIRDGQRLFLLSLNLLSGYSLANNDAPARATNALKRLWRSEKVFKNEDGSWNMELRVRNRFAVSVLYDCTWWGHEEFGGQSCAFTPGLGPTGELQSDDVADTDIWDPNLFSTMSLNNDWMMNDWWCYPSTMPLTDDGSPHTNTDVASLTG